MNQTDMVISTVMALAIVTVIIGGLAAFVLWVRGKNEPAVKCASVAGLAFFILWMVSLGVTSDI